MDIKATLLDELGEYYTHNLSWEEVKDTKFDDLGVDSLDKVEMIMGIEEHLDIIIPDEDLVDVTTPTQLLAVIDNLITKK